MNSILTEKLVEIRRSSENQASRCKFLLKKLKLIQLQELEDFAEKQFDSVIKNLAENKNIPLKETLVPDFLQKKKLPIPPVGAFEEEDYNERQEPGPSPTLYSKHGLDELTDVSLILRQTIKDVLFSTLTLWKDDEDTDSESDYEDEIQLGCSSNTKRGMLMYLPVEFNPAPEFAKARLDVMAKFAWIKDNLKTIDQRLAQHDQLLQYIKLHKPSFKFDEAPKCSKPVVMGTNLDFSTIEIYRENSERIIENFKRMDGAAGVPKLRNPTKGDGCGIGGGLEPLRLKFMDSHDPSATASRCVGVSRPFKHRKVLQIGGIHNVVGKPGRSPSTLCSCFGRTELCIICSGRSDKVKQVRTGAMARAETTALLDHNYHKVLSASEEKPLRLLTEACLKTNSWNKSKKSLPRITFDDPISEKISSPMYLRTAPIRPVIDLLPTETLEDKKLSIQNSTSKKVGKAKKSRKRKHLSDDEDEEEEDHWTPKKSTGADSHKKRRTDEKYDIDHIVIPYSIASATRVEKIEYKEIDIPSWRQIEPTKKPPPKKNTRHTRTSGRKVVVEPEVEDISLETITALHARAEEEEKKRFLNAMNVVSNRRSRRSETIAENSDFSQPASPLIDTSENIKEEQVSPSPHQISAADASLAVTALKISAPAISVAPQSLRRRTISSCKIEDDDIEEPGIAPFEPRKFPLSDEEYATMVKEMKESYQEVEERWTLDVDADEDDYDDDSHDSNDDGSDSSSAVSFNNSFSDDI